MPSVVLTPFIGANDLLGVGYRSGPIKPYRNAFPTKVLGVAW